MQKISAGLYFVATPIGTARDITLRGLDILREAEIIAAEDTRTARKLMDIHAISVGGRRLVALHDHSTNATVEYLVEQIRAGRSVAYVSEAGTPLVSDPGYELARAVIAADLPITSAPGPSAILAALAIGGLPTDRFMFVGFLPAAQGARQSEITNLKSVPATLVFYESPRRIGEVLQEMRDILGASRRAAVCRELTKRFEEVRRGTLDELAAFYAGDEPKGEIVLLVDRAQEEAAVEQDVEVALREAMKTMRVKDAATMVAGALNLPRRQVYQIALSMSSEG